MAEQPLLSIIVPIYNEEDGLEHLLTHLLPVLEGITHEWEILCINDGSKDGTLAALRHYAAAEPRVRYISLSRNFGKDAALSAGYYYARGQAVIPLDADLQDPPELIPQLVAKWQEGYKVVLATRQMRQGDGRLKRLTASGFYKLMARVASVPIPKNTGDFRLMDASAVAAINAMPERTRFMKGICSWVGFSTASVYYERPGRSIGAAKFNWRMMWRHAKDGIFSFTTLPLRLMTYLGALVSFIALVFAIYTVIDTWLHGVETPGYASLMTVLLLLGGLNLFCLGVIGEYIGRIYRETKQRPLFIVEETSV